ncbi:MAG: DUF115 domain-containing protein, partial [Rhodobacteraceae bacterium]|nr:DUF115 domain-containing protein [Paracoccaceae bacterium]
MPRGSAPLAQLLDATKGRIGLDDYLARVRTAMARPLPSLAQLIDSEKGGTLLICGGGPSIGDLAQLKTLRHLARKGGKVWAVNKTHDFLLTKGIVPWGACLLDPMPWVAGYIKRPRRDVKYFVASQCHGDVFSALKNANVYLWHAGIDVDGEGYPVKLLAEEYPGCDWHVVPGPTTVGLRSIMVGYSLGFRTFHLFGCDSSLKVGEGDARLYAYDKAKPKDAPERWVTLRTRAGDQRFLTNSHMARQTMDFEHMVDQIAAMVNQRQMEPIRIIVH